MKNLFFSLFCLSLLTFPVLLSAQSQSFTNVIKMRLRNSGSIIDGNELKGYYFFYQVDKINKVQNTYMLRITDANLNEIGTKNINESKYLYLMEASYNGGNILMKFVDYKNKLVKFKEYDTKGEMVFEKTKKIESKWDLALYRTEISADELQGNKLYSTSNGFVHYNYAKHKKVGYDITYFPADGSTEWTYSSPEDAQEIQYATFASSNADMVLSLVEKKKSLLSKDLDYYIVGHDIKTGKFLFEKPMVDGQHTLQISNAYINPETNQTILFGQYYDIKDKVMKSASKGMFAASIDTKGELKVIQYLSWEKDIAKFLPVNAKGKMKGEGYFYFHKFMTNSKGEVFAITEQYRKVVSGAGVAAAVLNGGNSNNGVLKIVIEDIVIFKFNPNFDLLDVKIYDKSKTSIELSQTYGTMSTILLGHVLKYQGYFDYCFTQISPDKSTITAGYIDYEKRKGEKNGTIFGAISMSLEAYAQDKLDLKRDGNKLLVFPAKFGYIMVLEYYKKEKKIDLKLEKLNY